MHGALGNRDPGLFGKRFVENTLDTVEINGVPKLSSFKRFSKH